MQHVAYGAFKKAYWRRGWDSNPRYGYPYTHFPGVRLRPLGHPSTYLCAVPANGLCAVPANALRPAAAKGAKHTSPGAAKPRERGKGEAPHSIAEIPG